MHDKHLVRKLPFLEKGEFVSPPTDWQSGDSQLTWRLIWYLLAASLG